MIPFWNRDLAMGVDLLRTNANIAISILSILVGFYQPIGPDLLIILKGLSGSEAYSAATVATVFTMVGSGLVYVVARIWGRKLMLRLFSKRIEAIVKAERFYLRYGGWFLFASAIGPIPLKYAIWISGLSGMPSKKFFSIVAVGLVPRFFAEATVARYFPDFLQSLMQRLGLNLG